MTTASMFEYASYDTRSALERFFPSSTSAWTAAGIAIIYLLYNSFLYLDLIPLLPLSQIFWNAFVTITPMSLAIRLDRWRNPAIYATAQPESQSRSEMHALKSEALRRVFGFESGALQAVPAASTMRRASWLGAMNSNKSHAPAGLGNWDNSCYQNSVLQGLSSLRSLTSYLETFEAVKQQDSSTTVGSLRDTMSRLNDAENNGSRIWTPAKLKSMSSWQQQDAQEYFSKIMDDMEKETAKVLAARVPSEGLREVKIWEGTEVGARHGNLDTERNSQNPKPAPQTPLDGQLAQRVACLRCGFTEGLSMIPFNCLTVPLGGNSCYDLSQCLDSYTGLEEISGVECAKCTLLQQKTQLENMTRPRSDESDTSLPESAPLASSGSTPSLPPELLELCLARLQAVQQALDNSDFSDATLNKKCQIPKKARVSSTKTKQMVVARAPTSLVIHVNRSMFDEYTGALRKNLAHVDYPKVLDLGPWCLGIEPDKDDIKEEWRMDAAKSMIAGSRQDINSERIQYVLRAAVCHYGRHENGHYICYREHPERAYEDDAEVKKMRWWRLSDDDVSSVTEEQVLSQGGVFMLFYEKVDTLLLPEKTLLDSKIEERVEEPHCVGDGPVMISAEEDTYKTEATIAISRPEVVELVQSAKPDFLAEGATNGDRKAASKPELANEVEASKEVKRPTATPASQPTQPELGMLPPIVPEAKPVTSPPTMRTARRNSKMSKSGFESAFRPVAAI